VNSPDRRRWSDSFDDDAMFADIVAHLNDDPAEDERAAQPPADEVATDVETTGEPVEETTTEPKTQTTAEPKAHTTSEPADLSPGDRPRADPNQWPINPPPWQPSQGDPQAVAAPQPWRGHEADDEYEEHFEPPPVMPLPAGDLAFWAIIAGMSGGPLLLLYLVFFNPDASSYWILGAIAMSVGGFALLVSRMPGHHEDDDDGARL
jgi:hypothetical protein